MGMTIEIRYWLLVASVAIYVNLDVLGQSDNIATLVLIEGIFVMVAANLVRWADAYEPEPLEWFIWSIVFGTGVSVGLAKFGYSLGSGNSLNTFWAATLEEFSKALVLLLPIWKRMISSWTDGFVYGSLAGLGFSFSEDLLYAVNDVDSVGLILYRDLNSVLAHSLFAGIVGAIMVAGLNKKNYWLCALSVPVGGAIHGLWNTFVGSNFTESTIILALMTPAAYVATAIALRDLEKRHIHVRVLTAVSEGELDELSARKFWDLRQRKLDRNRLPAAERKMFDRQLAISLKRIK